MKKKVIVLLLILVMVSSVFVGCDLFTKDGNRDYHQVVATINYDTGDSGVISSVLYKGEVLTYVQAYGAAYMAYQGMTPEAVVEYFYDNLTKQKLVILYAQEYLYDTNAVPAAFKTEFSSLGAWNAYKAKNGEAAAYKKFLTLDEYRYCIEQANAQFQESWNNNISELEKENDKNENTGKDESTDENTDTSEDKDLLEARQQKSETTTEENTEYKENADISSDKAMIEYFEKLYGIDLGENVDSAYFFNYVNELIKKEINNKDKYDNMKAALKTLRDSLEDQYMDYDYFLVQQMQTYIVDKYQKQIGDELDAEKVNANVQIKYDKQTVNDIEKYISSSDYKTALDSNTYVYAAPSKDYLQVKSILLSFSDKQLTGIEQIQKIFAQNEDLAREYRDAIATGFVGNLDKETIELYAKLGINVNVSNPDYKADEDELKNAYTDASIEGKDNVYANPAVSYLTVLYAMAEDIQAKVDMAVKYAQDNNMSALEQYLVKEYASQQAFNDWIYLVNDDSGMFSSDSYLVTPEGEATSYVEEYTVLARALTGAGVGAMAINDYSVDATSETGSASYKGSTEILKSANGAYTIYKKTLESSVGEGEDKLSADVYTMVTANNAEISFIVNEYGIHIVMLTGKPVDENKGTLTTQIKQDKDGEDVTMYVKGEDYVYSYEVTVEYAKDEDGNEDRSKIEKITVETTTIKENNEKLAKNEMSSDVSTLQQLGLFSNDTYTTKEDKVYKQIVEVAQNLSK